MGMLSIVNKSPFERNALSSCLRVQDKGAVLLIEDAVVAAVAGARFKERIQEVQSHLDIYVLMPDAKARGIGSDELIAGVKLVDYRGFVDLVVNHDNVQSWL